MPQARSRTRSLLILVALVLAPLLLLEIAGTLAAHSGYDFDKTYVSGDATVLSCERRGPVSVLYLGFWDECRADVRVGTSYPVRMTFDEPNLFHASDVGETVGLGRIRAGKSGSSHWVRSGFGPDRAIDVLVVILVLIDIIPLGLLVIFLVAGVKSTFRWVFRRRSAGR